MSTAPTGLPAPCVGALPPPTSPRHMTCFQICALALLGRSRQWHHAGHPSVSGFSTEHHASKSPHLSISRILLLPSNVPLPIHSVVSSGPFPAGGICVVRGRLSILPASTLKHVALQA